MLKNLFARLMKKEEANPILGREEILDRKETFEMLHKGGPLKIFWNNEDDLHQFQSAEMRSDDGVAFKIMVDLGERYPSFRFV